MDDFKAASAISRTSAAHTKIYHFHQVETCNMCGAPTADAKVIGTRLNRSQGRNPRAKTGIAVTICKCASCGLNFANPMPVPNHISDHYGVPPESYWKDEYFAPNPEYFRIQIEDAKRLLARQAKPWTALDIGAGIGKAMTALENAGFETWGLEPSEPFYSKAIELGGIREDRLLLSALEDAQYEEKFFDFITFGAVLEHLYDPAGSIERALRWLKPCGVIQIEVPSSNHLMPAFLNAYFRVVGTNYVTNLSPMHPPYHLYAFTPESFRRHGARANYQIAYHYIDVASVRHVPPVAKQLLRKYMAMTNRGQQLTVWLRHATSANANG